MFQGEAGVSKILNCNISVSQALADVCIVRRMLKQAFQDLDRFIRRATIQKGASERKSRRPFLGEKVKKPLIGLDDLDMFTISDKRRYNRLKLFKKRTILIQNMRTPYLIWD